MNIFILENGYVEAVQRKKSDKDIESGNKFLF